MRAFLRSVLAWAALGAGGCVHAQTGPVIGVSSKHGPVAGWEAGAGVGVLSGSLGADVTPFGERTASLYFAAEPGLALPVRSMKLEQAEGTFVSGGATIGYAVDDRGLGAMIAGGWGAVPWLVSSDCVHGFAKVASVSAGVRVFVGADDVHWVAYASPKLGMLGDCPDLHVGARF